MTDVTNAAPLFVDGDERGVLVLHGFTGHPGSMRSLAQSFAEHGFTVRCPLLPGHGGDPRAINQTTFDDWSKAAQAQYDELRTRCARVAVVGLSMGGTLTAWLGERNTPDALVFINPFIQGAPRTTRLVSLLVKCGLRSWRSLGSDIKKPGVSENAASRTPLQALDSLLNALPAIEGDLSRVSAPSLLLSSRVDHTVPPRNGDILAAGVSGPVERVWLENSYHVATVDNDQALLEEAAVSFVERQFA